MSDINTVQSLIADFSEANYEAANIAENARLESVAIVRLLETKLTEALAPNDKTLTKLGGAHCLAEDIDDGSKLVGWRVRGDNTSAKLESDREGNGIRSLVLLDNGRLAIARLVGNGAGCHYAYAADTDIRADDTDAFIRTLAYILPIATRLAKNKHKRYSEVKALNAKIADALK